MPESQEIKEIMSIRRARDIIQLLFSKIRSIFNSRFVKLKSKWYHKEGCRMKSVKGQLCENCFRAKIKGVFLDHNFIQFYHHALIPNVSVNDRSGVRGSHCSLRSNNSFITDNTEKQKNPRSG